MNVYVRTYVCAHGYTHIWMIWKCKGNYLERETELAREGRERQEDNREWIWPKYIIYLNKNITVKPIKFVCTTNIC